MVADALKHRFNRGKRSNLHFYRESTGHEVDLIYAAANDLGAIEIKSGATIGSDYFRELRRLDGVLGDRVRARAVVYAGESDRTRHGIPVTNPLGLESLLRSFDEALGLD